MVKRVVGATGIIWTVVKRLRSSTDACCTTQEKELLPHKDNSKCTNSRVSLNGLYIPPHRRKVEIASTTTPVYAHEQMAIEVRILEYETRRNFFVSALIDSGCTTSAIDKEFVKTKKIPTQKMPKAILVYNADGTKNQGGDITEYVKLQLEIQGHKERATFVVTNLRSHPIFLGADWLKTHNPIIDWTVKALHFTRCPEECGKEFTPVIKSEERLYYFNTTSWLEEEEIHIRASSNISMDLAAAAEQKKVHKSWQEIIPQCFHQFEKVFTKDSFGELPPR